METTSDGGSATVDVCEIDEIELSDLDILDAMRHIPGYLDVSTEDFRLIYHLAHANAIDHLLGGMTPASLVRRDLAPLGGDLLMDQAARRIAESGYKGLPVVDAAQRVVGMLTETDFLRRLKAASFLELMLRLLSDPGGFSHRCHETRVAEAMTQPVVTISVDAGFREVMDAFTRHPGRAMPVVDAQERFVGMLLRKDFLMALHRRTGARAPAELTA
jgi:CBS domain-containing membrane protein